MNLREADIQRSICDWLTAKKIFWKRMPLGGVLGHRGGKQFMMKNPMTGFPDLFAIIPPRGRLLTIEVKKPETGRISPEQRKWRDDLMSLGAIYIEARSLDDVIQAFEERFG